MNFSSFVYASTSTATDAERWSSYVYANATTLDSSGFGVPPFDFGTIIDHVTMLASVARAQLVSQPATIITASSERDIFVTPLEGSNQQFSYESQSQYGELQAFVILSEYFFSNTGEFKPPVKGDKITFVVGGFPRTYEVNPPDSGPEWEWYGLGKKSLLVYSMRMRRGKQGEM